MEVYGHKIQCGAQYIAIVIIILMLFTCRYFFVVADGPFYLCIYFINVCICLFSLIQYPRMQIAGAPE